MAILNHRLVKDVLILLSIVVFGVRVLLEHCHAISVALVLSPGLLHELFDETIVFHGHLKDLRQ